jgi:hypothetical protein
MLNDEALKQITGGGTDQRSQRKRQPEAATAPLDKGQRERADSDEFAVRHVDDVHQPEDDRQTERDQHENADQRHGIEDYRYDNVHGLITGEIAMQNLNFIVSSHPNKSIAEVSKDMMGVDESQRCKLARKKAWSLSSG